MYKSNLTQTWRQIFQSFQFQILKASYLELIIPAQNANIDKNVIFNRHIHRKWLWNKTFRTSNKKLLKWTINNNSNSEDTNKIVKPPWIPIIGFKLRKAFKNKNIKIIFASSSNLKTSLCPNKTTLLRTVIQEYTNKNVRGTHFTLMKLWKRYYTFFL